MTVPESVSEVDVTELAVPVETTGAAGVGDPVGCPSIGPFAPPVGPVVVLVVPSLPEPLLPDPFGELLLNGVVTINDEEAGHPRLSSSESWVFAACSPCSSVVTVAHAPRSVSVPDFDWRRSATLSADSSEASFVSSLATVCSACVTADDCVPVGNDTVYEPE